MKQFYHFSHLLELLCGVYFGSLALFEHVEAAAQTLNNKIGGKRKDLTILDTKFTEHFKMVPTNSPKEVLRKLVSWVWCKIKIIICRLSYRLSGSRTSHFNEKNSLSKKYYPPFFFAGCFSMMLLALTAFSEAFSCENLQVFLDNFLVCYVLSAIIFYFISYRRISKMIHIREYIYLIVLSFLLAAFLMTLSIVLSCLPITTYYTNDLFKEDSLWFIITSAVIVLFLPLFFLVVEVFFVLLAWAIPTHLHQSLTRKAKVDMIGILGSLNPASILEDDDI